jgi:transcriptional regulator with XRE-family HTH domain
VEQNATSRREILGSRIKSIREELGITQHVFADHLDVDIRTVQRIEKGEQNFTIDILFKILDVFKISADELLGDSKNNKYS